MKGGGGMVTWAIWGGSTALTTPRPAQAESSPPARACVCVCVCVSVCVYACVGVCACLCTRLFVIKQLIAPGS